MKSTIGIKIGMSALGAKYLGVFALILLAALPARAMDQTTATTLASNLLTQSGRHCTMIAVPHCGSGELVKAFWTQAGDSRLIVDAFESDSTLLASAQQKAGGLLGRTLYVRSGSLSTNAYSLPFADQFCARVVFSGLASSDVAGALSKAS